MQYEIIVLAAMIGLLVGSFLNVVIYRLPIMLNRAWKCQCEELLEIENTAPEPTFNLLVPRSRCGECGHQIKWYENIPLLSYIVLRGQCSSCKTPFGLRYPLVELVTGVLFGYCAWRWGQTWTTALWCVVMAALVSLFFIDWDTTLLPDNITLPLLWLGILAAALGLNPLVSSLKDAVYGAMVGYLSLWAVYWLFKLTTGKEGMGYGDFKLLAALCAWLGLNALIPIILFSSVVGVIGGILMKIFSGLREGGYVPFGPFLIGAALLVVFFGTDVTKLILP